MKLNKWTIGLAAVGLVSLPTMSQADEKWSSVNTALSSTIISGYINTAAQWNLGTGNANNPGYAFGGAGKADGFNLNVAKVTIEKPLDAADQWAAGYKADFILGPDAVTLATGTGLKQAYVQLRAPLGNGLDLKMGVFDTIVGYEVFDSGNNPNYTRSYGYTIEPTTHEGLLASYQFNDIVGASVGIANTHGPLIGGRANPPKAESYKTYMGSVTLTAPESLGFLKGSTLYMGAINGFLAPALPGGNNGPGVEQNLYVGATVNTPVTGLKAGISYDYAGRSAQTLAVGGTGSPTLNTIYRNAVGIYTSYQATEKLSLHGRGEYVTQSKANLNGAVNNVTVAGLPSKILAYTATVQYDLWKNVLSRFELRWDHQADGTGKAYGGDPRGTSTPSRRNAYMAAVNIIYKF